MSETRVPGAGRSGREPGLAVLLVIVFGVSLLSLPAVRYDGDVFAWEMEAENLVHHGRLDVRASVAESLPKNAPFFLFNAETGRWHSKYGIGNTILYAIPLAFERFVLGVTGVDPPGQIFGPPTGPYAGTRRLALFNGFNLLLTLWLAGALYRMARLYTPRASIAAAFALICLYSTYLWNYTRAHSSQIYQVLFFSLAVVHFIRFARAGLPEGRRNLLFGALALSALCAVKTVFLPLIAAFGLAVVFAGGDPQASPLERAKHNFRHHLGDYARYALVPVLALLCVLALANAIKFGAPWKLGYEREANLWGGRLADSIPAYLIAPRFSMFVHFPVLAVAAFGVPRMWRAHRDEYGCIVACFALMFGIYANYTFWTAEASYGPRYLLFGLPALALPLVPVLEQLRGVATDTRRFAATALLSLFLAVCIAAQIEANRLEFHAFFRLRHQFQSIDARDPELNRYLRETNTALFNRDFIRFRDGGDRPLPLERLERKLPPAGYAKLEAATRGYLASNHLFFEQTSARSAEPGESAELGE